MDTSIKALTGRGGANKTQILAGGKQIVTSGNTRSICIYGKQYLKTKAMDRAAKVYKGGIQYVSKGAVAASATIFVGGKQHVYNGGRASKTTVSSGGIEYVHSGGIASATNVVKGGSLIVSAGAKARALVLGANGKVTIQGGALTGTTKLNGGTLTVTKTGNTAYKLALKQAATICYDIRSVKTGVGTMFTLSNTATANNGFSVVVKASQAKGSYKLSSNLSVAKGTEFTIKVGSKAIGTAKLGKAALVNNGVAYSVSKKSNVVMLTLGTANAVKNVAKGWSKIPKSITYNDAAAVGNYLSSASPSLATTSSGQSLALSQAGLASVS